MTNELAFTDFIDNFLLFIFLGACINHTLRDLLKYMLLALFEQSTLFIALL